MKITVLAPAKINLGLEILNKRTDGYHNVNMILHSIGLYDKVTIEKSVHSEIEIQCTKSTPCVAENNIAYKATQMFFKHKNIKNPGIRITIEKNIPFGAGLAGGSADGAATFMGLNHLFGANMNFDLLKNLGSKIGADIPFCMKGGCAQATDNGTQLNALKSLENCYVVLVKPPIFISTQKAYELSDNLKKYEIKNLNILRNAIENNDLSMVGKNLFNRFEEVLKNDEILKIKKNIMNQHALGAVMSGSGSTVFGIFDNIFKATECVNNMRKCYPESFLCKTVNHGVYFVK